MKVLFDNNLPPSAARAINAVVEDEVVALREKFAANATDEEWLSTLGSEGGWTVVTLDKRILKRPAERAALRRSRVNAFFLKPGWLKPGWQKRTRLQLTAHLLLRWPSLQQTVTLVGGGLYFVPVNAGAKLEQHHL